MITWNETATQQLKFIPHLSRDNSRAVASEINTFAIFYCQYARLHANESLLLLKFVHKCIYHDW